MNKHNLIIAGAAALILAAGGVIVSCVRNGKTESVNTGRGADGRIFTCYAFSSVSKVIAINGNGSRRRTELASNAYTYNTETGELFIASNTPDVESNTVFHLEGTPCDPPVYILNGYDPAHGEAVALVNGTRLVQNRDYTIDTETNRLQLLLAKNSIHSHYIIWETADGGMSSSADMTESESDTYSELAAAWTTELMRKTLAAEEYDSTLFIDAESGTAEVILRPFESSEKQTMLDELPIVAIKNRTTVSANRLSKEVGFRVPATKTVSAKNGAAEYERVSVLLLDSAVKGVHSLSVEQTFVCASNASASIVTLSISGEPFVLPSTWSIKREQLSGAPNVEKEIAWYIQTQGADTTKKTAVQGLTYTWEKDGTFFRIETAPENAAEIESFITAAFSVL